MLIARVMLSMVMIALAGSARADFCMLTQNGLRFGSSAPEEKLEAFRRTFSRYDLVVMQEVMDEAELAPLLGPHWRQALSAPLGAGSYRERYLIAWDSRALTRLDEAQYQGEGFSRPPFGVALGDRDGGRFWVVDFHAVWGKSVERRRDEAAAMAEAMAFFAARRLPDGSTVERVVVAGDWNLPATDPGFEALAGKAPVVVRPDLPTTLNPSGRYVSAYDHYVWNPAALAVHLRDDPRETGGTEPEPFRRAVSDHAGVGAYVRAGAGSPPPRWEGLCPRGGAVAFR